MSKSREELPAAAGAGGGTPSNANLDYEDRGLDEHVRSEIDRILALWRGPTHIKRIYDEFIKISDDQLFIREVLREAKKDFYYTIYIDPIEIDGLTVEVPEIEYEVDVERDEVTCWTPCLEEEIFAKLLEKHDGGEDAELSEEEEEGYRDQAKNIADYLSDLIRDRVYGELDEKEIFEPVQKALETVFERRINASKQNFNPADISFFIDESCFASEEPYDKTKYAACIIKMVRDGYNRVFIRDIQNLISSNKYIVYSVIYNDITTSAQYLELQDRYEAARQSRDGLVQQHQALVAVSRILSDDIRKKMDLIYRDYRKYHEYRPIFVLERDELRIIPAGRFDPERYHTEPEFERHLKQVKTYIKTFPADEGPVRLIYPSKHPLKRDAEVDIRPLLMGVREQGQRIHAVLAEEMAKSQREKYEERIASFSDNINRINPVLIRLEDNIRNSPQYQAARKINEAVVYLQFYPVLLGSTDGINEARGILESNRISLPRNLQTAINLLSEDLSSKENRTTLINMLTQVNKELHGTQLFSVLEIIKKVRKCLSTLNGTAIRHQDFTTMCQEFLELGSLKTIGKEIKKYFAEVRKLFNLVKERPPNEFQLKDTTNVIFPIFIFCVSTVPPRLGLRTSRIFVPVGLNIEGFPFLISGDPEDKIFESDVRRKIGERFPELVRRELYEETEAAKIRSAAREDRAFRDIDTNHPYTEGIEAEILLDGADRGTGRKFRRITGHSERVLTRALRNQVVVRQLVNELRGAIMEEARQGKISFVTGGPLKIYSVSMLLYSDNTICQHCTRTIISSMHDWQITPEGEKGFMKLLADELNRLHHVDGNPGFIAYEPTDYDGNRDVMRNGMRGNAIVVADRLYTFDEHGQDVRSHPSTRIAHTHTVDIKRYSDRGTFIEIIGLGPQYEEVTPVYIRSRGFMSGSALDSLNPGAIKKADQEVGEDILSMRDEMDIGVARALVRADEEDGHGGVHDAETGEELQSVAASGGGSGGAGQDYTLGRVRVEYNNLLLNHALRTEFLKRGKVGIYLADQLGSNREVAEQLLELAEARGSKVVVDSLFTILSYRLGVELLNRGFVDGGASGVRLLVELGEDSEIAEQLIEAAGEQGSGAIVELLLTGNAGPGIEDSKHGAPLSLEDAPRGLPTEAGKKKDSEVVTYHIPPGSSNFEHRANDKPVPLLNNDVSREGAEPKGITYYIPPGSSTIDDNSVIAPLLIIGASIVKFVETKESFKYIFTEVIPINIDISFIIGLYNAGNIDEEKQQEQSEDQGEELYNNEKGDLDTFISEQGVWSGLHLVGGLAISFSFSNEDVSLTKKILAPASSTSLYALRHVVHSESCAMNILTSAALGGFSALPYSVMTGSPMPAIYGGVQAASISAIGCLGSNDNESGYIGSTAASIATIGSVVYSYQQGALTLTFTTARGILSSISKIASTVSVVSLVHKTTKTATDTAYSWWYGESMNDKNNIEPPQTNIIGDIEPD